jgi:GrpB-like predicted nucleotidyltransferase (UPF0157 family)
MPIEIAHYDPKWPLLFEQEADRLRAALGDVALRIDHVGSTAVPGLGAKPVIDIQVSVAALEPVDGYRLPLEGIGYTYTTVPLPYFYRPEVWPHSHHVHVRESGSRDEQRTLAFRDWLREHDVDRAGYEALKRKLASGADADSMGGRFLYSEAKTEFVRDVELRSLVDE